MCVCERERERERDKERDREKGNTSDRQTRKGREIESIPAVCLHFFCSYYLESPHLDLKFSHQKVKIGSEEEV